jgi:DDE superfamily endonuclease
LLTLFHPASGEVRAKGVTQATNALVHPWLKAELLEILAQLPPVADAEAPWRQWEHWGWDATQQAHWGVEGPLPPIRLILVWDNLSGHKNRELVRWLVTQGVLPLYTPLGGSWLNMAESVQRIVVRRALAGQHPETGAELIEWLEATVAGWNREPTPFEWGGKRAARRQRARERHRQGGSGAYTRRRIPRRTALEVALTNYNSHDN